MTTPSRLPQQLDSYDEWTRRLVAYVARLQPWLQKLGLYTAEAHRAIQRSLDLLGKDRITVAVVGEFSRGKTELINALFFPLTTAFGCCPPTRAARPCARPSCSTTPRQRSPTCACSRSRRS